MRIETERLILRSPKKGDEKDLVKNINNKNLTKNMSNMPFPYSRKDANSFIKKSDISLKENKIKSYKIVLELKSSGEVVGGIGLGDIDYFSGTGDIGYWLGENYWRQGLMSEAVNAIINWAFDVLKLRRIDLSAYPENGASNALAKKMGFKFEGTRRKARKNITTNEIHDLNIYGLLREDWHET